MPGAHATISQGASYLQQPNKHYISTRAFSTANTTGTIFTYTTSLNASFQNVGTLAANTNATAANCPVGRVVHANGKRLYPSVHPNITKVYVGVFDPVSFLNGYIDPTDSTWAVYDTSLGATFDLGATGSTTQDTVLAGQGAESRFGRRVDATTTGTTTTGAADIGAGRTGILTVANAPTVITVSSSEVKADSIILLTLGTATTSVVNFRISTITAGNSFVITAASGAFAAGDKINYLIIN